MTNTTDKRLISGIDIFVEAPFECDLPKQVGSLTLSHISSRGTKLKGAALEKTILDVGWLCARYTFEKPVNNSTEADSAICNLVQKVGSTFKWSSIIKLYSQDGKPLFS
ncbi:MAG: hypothetical protein RI953_2252 [Pseudomonadota bacterium]|jgi:hypothetical protein